MTAARARRAPLLFGIVACGAGAASLVGELVWLRYLSLIFGITTYAVAAGLGSFMLGLALGSWHLGRAADRHPHPVRLLALLQLALGVFLAVSPWLYAGLADLAAALSRELQPASAARPVLRFALALGTLLVPAYVAGGTLPVLLRAAARSDETASRAVGWYYAAGTLGGALGALATGFWLLPQLGLSRTLWAAAAMQIVLALVLLVFWRGTAPRIAGTPPPPPQARPNFAPHSLAGHALAVAGISGFTSLAYEVYWTRALTYFFRDSIYDLALVLAVFLTGLGLGSAAAAGWLRRQRDAAFGLALCQMALALTALGGLFLLHRFPYWLNDLQTNTALVRRFGGDFWPAAVGLRAAYAALLMLPPTLLLGAAFPLAARLWVGEDPAPGRRFGGIAAINTLGAALGALAAGFLLIPLFGLWRSVTATALANLLAGALVLAAGQRPNAGRWLMAGTAAAALLFAALPRWDPARMSAAFLAPGQAGFEELLDVRFHREDAAGLTSVVELRPTGVKYLVTNRLYTQNTSALGGLEDHRRLGMIPLLLHPQPERVLAVGLGAGLTLRGAVALKPASVECAELAPGVIAAAREQFAAENGRVLDDARVRIVPADGRNFLATTDHDYDVIILDILFPMSSGSSAVFSREYYELGRARLRPGGLVCQWLPAHQLSTADLQAAAATFQSVFPHVSLWYGLLGETGVIGLVGSEQPQVVDYPALAARYRDPALRRELQAVNLGDPALLFSHFIAAGPRLAAFSYGAPVDTDDRPVLEFSTPKLPRAAPVQGMMNLLVVSRLSDGLGPAVSDPGPDAPALRERLPRAVAAKKALLEGFALELAGDRAARLRLYRAALARDPANPDLRAATHALEITP